MRPGSNNPRRPIRKGRVSDTRESWISMPRTEFILFVGWEDDEEPVPGEPEPVRLTIRPAGGRQFTIFLSTLTVAEIDVMQNFLVRAFTIARPAAQALDQIAVEALKEGDTTYARLYRTVPELVVRERSKPAHDQGVPIGSAGVLPVDRDTGPDEPDEADTADRPAGESVHLGASRGLEAQDDVAQDGDAEGVR